MDMLITATKLIVAARISLIPLAVAGIGLALLTAPITGPALLAAVGFSAAGPIAGSIAAAWQASIGLVQAGSLFALFQSAAMGGAAGGLFAVISGIGAVIAGTAVGVAGFWGKIMGLW